MRPERKLVSLEKATSTDDEDPKGLVNRLRAQFTQLHTSMTKQDKIKLNMQHCNLSFAYIRNETLYSCLVSDRVQN